MVSTIMLQSYENQVWNHAIVAGSGLSRRWGFYLLDGGWGKLPSKRLSFPPPKKFCWKKIYSYKHYIFKIFRGSMPPDPPRRPTKNTGQKIVSNSAQHFCTKPKHTCVIQFHYGITITIKIRPRGGGRSPYKRIREVPFFLFSLNFWTWYKNC